MLLDGPLLTLTPRAAVALSMVFHELAANAARHGALSRPGGRVQVSWRLRRTDDEPPALALSWREVGGPRVARPLSTGFGARMVERTIRAPKPVLRGRATRGPPTSRQLKARAGGSSSVRRNLQLTCTRPPGRDRAPCRADGCR